MSVHSSTIKTAAAALGIAVAGVFGATTASASPDVLRFGQTGELSNAGGSQVIDYAVGNLQPSGHNDGVWFSDVNVTAAKGNATPIVGNFKALGANGAEYHVMEGRQPDGLTNDAIAPGTKTHGRIYFQVGSGTPPDSVAYSEGAGTGADRLIWKR